MDPYRAVRALSTSGRVHPRFLPHLRRSRLVPLGWLAGLAGVSAAACAIASNYGARAARQAERDELQRRNQVLTDVYGDRSSLDELQKAVEFYDKKQ